MVLSCCFNYAAITYFFLFLNILHLLHYITHFTNLLYKILLYCILFVFICVFSLLCRGRIKPIIEPNNLIIPFCICRTLTKCININVTLIQTTTYLLWWYLLYKDFYINLICMMRSFSNYTREVILSLLH